MGYKKLIIGSSLFVFFCGCNKNNVFAQVGTIIPGVQSSLSIDTTKQTFSIPDEHFVYVMYKIVMNRDPDVGGFTTWINMLKGGTSRDAVFSNLLSSTELANNVTLKDRDEYIRRVYRVIFGREADPGGMATYQGIVLPYGQPGWQATWYRIYADFQYGPEARNNCDKSMYSYGKPLKSSSPTLADFYNGTAQFQVATEAQRLNYTNWQSFGITRLYGEKVSSFWDQASNSYYAFVRGDKGGLGGIFDIYLIKSSDGLNWQFLSKVFDKSASGFSSLYDPHISIDYLSCPRKYIMTMECDANLCVSESVLPTLPYTWTKPKKIIGASNWKSASTGVTLQDVDKQYISWTQVDDGSDGWFLTATGDIAQPDLGTERTQTLGMEMPKNSGFLGYSESVGTVQLPAEANTHCASKWDCNNRDAQDWKKEGNYYYLFYNGANYYRCFRYPSDRTNYTSDWGLSVSRSTNPLTGYDWQSSKKLIQSDVNWSCAISYNTINEINGELFMYYDYFDRASGDAGARTLRSKLLWKQQPTNTPLPPTPTFTTAPPQPTPTGQWSCPPNMADANGDKRVDGLDFGIWRTEFLNQTGKTSDFNNDGVVDGLDFAMWRNQYLTNVACTFVIPTLTSTPVPPTSTPLPTNTPLPPTLVPVTCSITSVPTSATTNSSVSFSATGSGGSKVVLYRRQIGGDGSWVPFTPELGASGGTASTTFPNAATYQVVCNVVRSDNSIACSGNPDGPGLGVADCGASDLKTISVSAVASCLNMTLSVNGGPELKSATVNSTDSVSIRLRIANSNNIKEMERFYFYDAWPANAAFQGQPTLMSSISGGTLFTYNNTVSVLQAPLGGRKTININGYEMVNGLGFNYSPDCQVLLNVK